MTALRLGEGAWHQFRMVHVTETVRYLPHPTRTVEAPFDVMRGTVD
jgi:hypothetical protein